MQLVGDLGGLSRMLSELGAVRSGELVGRGPQVYAVTMLLPTLFQWWLVYELRSGHRNRRYLALTLCLISSLLGGLLGFRGPIAALLIQTATIWYLFTGRPTKRSMVVAMAVVIPVATLSSILRLTFNEVAFEKLGDADPRLVIGYLSDTALTRVRGVEAFTVLHTKMESLPYGMFLANVRESVLALVPSAIVDKPISVTEDIATQVFSDYLFDAGIIKDIYGGVSYTYISEGYWNLGYLGVLMQGFVFGWLFNCCSRLELSRRPTDLEVLFYKACAGFALLLVEAPQLGVNAIILNVFVNLLIVTALSMRLLPAPTSAAGPPLSR